MNKLTYFLKRTGAIEVHLVVSQVAELVGEQKAAELALYVVNESEIRTKFNRPRSAVPMNKRINKNALGCYNRKEVLKAIEAATGEAATLSPGEKPPANPIPNPELLPSKNLKVLQDRGIIES